MTKPQSQAVVVSDTMEEFRKAAESLVSRGEGIEGMIASIMEATDLDAILGTDVTHLQDITPGTPFTINSASIVESDFKGDGSLGVYIVMKCEYDNGEYVVITTGSTTIVPQVIQMHRCGLLPARVTYQKAVKPTDAGYYPLRLAKAKARPTQEELALEAEFNKPF